VKLKVQAEKGIAGVAGLNDKKESVPPKQMKKRIDPIVKQ
jgi:hypothetical protein